MDSQVSDVVRQICHLISLSVDPATNQIARAEASAKLNDISNAQIFATPDRYMQVAFGLIGNLDAHETPDHHKYLLELYAHYGFKLINDLIKFNWYQFDSTVKQGLKARCVDWCESRLFTNGLISTSSLVMNACSMVITEIFIREWPNNWPTFIADCTRVCSLVTVYAFLNISDQLYKHTQITPNRRKEITKVLQQNASTIYGFFCATLDAAISDTGLSIEYRQKLMLKSLQTLESLFEWMCLSSAPVIDAICNVATAKVIPFFDAQHSYHVKLYAYRCIQALLRCNSATTRPADAALIDAKLRDVTSPNSFACTLVTHTIPGLLVQRFTPDTGADYHELFTVVLEVAIEILCQSLALYNRSDIDAAARSSIAFASRPFWSSAIGLTVNCLEKNIVTFDEVIGKFLLIYAKLARNDASSGSNENADDDAAAPKTKPPMHSPIDIEVDRLFAMNLITLIGRYKTMPKSCDDASECELRYCHNIDSYESYCDHFALNLSKYKSIIVELVASQPYTCQVYIVNLLRAMLGDSRQSESIERWVTHVETWNVAATMCALIIPRLTVTAEFVSIFETYFERLLTATQDGAKSGQTLSCILSALSSMSSFYRLFAHNLIQRLIVQIFSFASRPEPDADCCSNTYNRSSDMQNHAGALFIKLSTNCADCLLPFFEMMRTEIGRLRAANTISGHHFCAFYEGLLILSNHFSEVEHQRRFVHDHYLPKLDHVVRYDSGPNGSHFFRDIGLAREPDPASCALPLSESTLFIDTSNAINLLTRLFRRMNPDRFLAIVWSPKLFEYIQPFFRLMASLNALWHCHRANDQASLDVVCHRFYRPFIFAEAPHYYLHLLCSDRHFLVPNDRLKQHFARWNRKTPPSQEMIGLHAAHRIGILYSQTVTFLAASLNHLLYCYSLDQSSEAMVEQFFNDSFRLLFANAKALPLAYQYEFMKLYLRHLISYCPRTERFFRSTAIVDILNDYLPFLFASLDHKFDAMKKEKHDALSNSEPAITPVIHFDATTAAQQKRHNRRDADEDNMELCMELLHTAVGQEFINTINEIFAEPKRIEAWASKYQQTSNKQPLNDDDENMNNNDDDDEDNADDKKIGEATNRNSSSSNNVDADAMQLPKHILASNASPLVIVVTNCLLWPLDNLRATICDTNQILVRLLFERGAMNSIDSFYYVAERIIRAISLTEKSDCATVNRLLALFISLYQAMATAATASEEEAANRIAIVNEQLAQICAVDVAMWTAFAQTLSASVAPTKDKKLQQRLKTLLENVYSKATASLHSFTRPNLRCLGDGENRFRRRKNRLNSTDNVSATNDDDDDDTFSLAWLL